MNKLDFRPSGLTPASDTRSAGLPLQGDPVDTGIEQRGRLLVLLPADVDYSSMARQLCELAKVTTSAGVRLLSLSEGLMEEAGFRRRLATLAALIREGEVPAEAQVETGANWVDCVKRNIQKGDLIVCFAEQRSGLFQRPLAQILRPNMGSQVYILSNPNAHGLPRPKLYSRILAWAGSMGIIVGSFLLQTRILWLPQDWAQTTLLLASVAGEIWLIWAWNSLFS